MDVVLVSKNGMVKRTAVDEFRQQGRGGSGIAAMTVAEGDQVVGAVGLNAQTVMIVTAGGRAIRFAAEELRQMGRAAQGVRGIRLNEGDRVVAVLAV